MMASRSQPDASTAEDGDGARDGVQRFFAGVGRVVVRFRYLVVLTWLVFAVASVAFLPSLSSVTNGNNSSFLPTGQPSVKAAQLAGPFQRGTLPQALLVATRAGGPLTPADNTAIARAETAVRQVVGVVGVRDQGVSRDGQARKIQVTLTGDAAGMNGAKNYVNAIRATFSRVGAPGGLSLYLTGPIVAEVDNAASNSSSQSATSLLSIVVILVLLFMVYRSILAPFLTLLPAALVWLAAGPVIAESHQLFGIGISPITQILLIVLLLGAGTDYGLFLVFRVREEMRRGLDPHPAIVRALARVGETIAFSAGTVIAALLCLLLASFGFYKGLGPSMAIGVAIMLLAGLTLMPALLAIFGRAAFWPNRVGAGEYKAGIWGRVAGRIVQQPILVFLTGVLAFGALAVYGVLTYAPAGFGKAAGAASATSQSARGTAAINAHFPAAQANPTNLLFRYPTSVWQNPSVLAQATKGLGTDRVFRSTNGPLDPNGTHLSTAQLQQLHAQLGSAIKLAVTPPAGSAISPALYNAYRATAQFISPDGHTVQFYSALAAGAPDSNTAMRAVPSIRGAVTGVATATKAVASGVAGEAAFSYDISSLSDSDLLRIVPVALLVIGVLLGLVLRSLVAPWYLLASVGLSYLAALGVAVVVFMGFGGGSGLSFFLPFLMFIFLMALGSDYNILVMTRIREESHEDSLPAAVTRAIGATGGTVTSAGLILAGSFLALTAVGGAQVQQIGLGIAAGILMDTFLVRTLLIPSVVVLLGRWNWWPSRLTGGPTRQSREAA